jgi:large subunit ribosomal protein L22
MSVSHALSILNYTPKKAALLVGKTLQSAVANAEHNHQLDADDLFVKSALATDGPALKRIMPRARGSAAAIKKKSCHITIILAGKEAPKPVVTEEAAAAPAAKKKAARKTAAKAKDSE